MTSVLASTSVANMVLAQATFPALLTIAIIFFVIALIAYILGARGVAGMSAGIGRTLLFVFLILAVIFAIVGLVNHA